VTHLQWRRECYVESRNLGHIFLVQRLSTVECDNYEGISFSDDDGDAASDTPQFRAVLTSVTRNGVTLERPLSDPRESNRYSMTEDEVIYSVPFPRDGATAAPTDENNVAASEAGRSLSNVVGVYTEGADHNAVENYRKQVLQIQEEKKN
jgi:hypothetical protein